MEYNSANNFPNNDNVANNNNFPQPGQQYPYGQDKDNNPSQNQINYPEIDPMNNSSNSNGNSQPNLEFPPTKKECPPARKKTLQCVSEYGKNVIIAMIIALILSTCIAGLGLALLAKSAKSIAVPLLVFSFVSILALCWGIYAVKVYSERCDQFLADEKNQSIEDIDQSQERTFFNVAMYLIMLLFIFFLLASIFSYALGDEIYAQIKSIAQNSTKWKSYFGNISYETIQKSIKTIMIASGAISILQLGVLSYILFYAYKMLGAYRAIQTLVQFVCLCFLKVGLLFLYFAIYAHRFREISKVEKSLPPWVPDALLGISVVALIISIFGYVASYTENIDYLKIFSIVTAVYTFAIIVLAVGGILFVGKFKDYFENNCTKILDYVNQDYLKSYVGCQKKYTFVSPSIDRMACPKNRIVNEWESNLGIEVNQQIKKYGCINMECCYATYSFLKGKFDHVAIFAFILFLSGCIMAGGSFYMIQQLNIGIEDGLNLKKTQTVLYAKIVVVAIVIIILICLVPQPPTPNPINSIEIVPADPGSDTLNNNNFNKPTNNTPISPLKNITNITIIDNPVNVGLNYTYTLTTNYGRINTKSMIPGINVITNQRTGNNGWTYSFNTLDINIFKNLLNYFTIDLPCPLTPSNLNVVISGLAYNYTSNNKLRQSFIQLQARSLQINNDGLDNVVLSLGNITAGSTYNILNRDYPYSLIDTNKFQYVTGQIYKTNFENTQDSAPLANAVVKLTSPFPECEFYTMNTNAQGNFKSPKIYNLLSKQPMAFRIEANYPQLREYASSFMLGDLGSSENADLGKIDLFDPTIVKKTTFSAKIIDSLNNNKLSDVSVVLYKGYKATSLEEFKNSNLKTSFLQKKFRLKIRQLNNDKVITVKSDYQGAFTFKDLPPNQYTMEFTKDGYYTETHCI